MSANAAAYLQLLSASYSLLYVGPVYGRKGSQVQGGGSWEGNIRT